MQDDGGPRQLRHFPWWSRRGKYSTGEGGEAGRRKSRRRDAKNSYTSHLPTLSYPASITIAVTAALTSIKDIRGAALGLAAKRERRNDFVFPTVT